MKWGHNALADDLAAHLRANSDRVVWTDMQLGPAGSPRPDVYTIQKQYTRFTPLAYECKVSVADFRRDVTAGKWQSYLQFAAGVIFAVPAGLIKKEDVPPGCGLIVRHDEVWRTVKGPTLKVIDTLPRDAWMKLIIDGLDRQQKAIGPRVLNQWSIERKIREKHGAAIADALHDLHSAESRLKMRTAEVNQSAEQLQAQAEEQVKHARQHAERELDRIRLSQSQLARMLGLPADAKLHDISHAIQRAIQRLDRDEEVRRLRRHIEAIQTAMQRATEAMPAFTVIDDDRDELAA